MTGKRLCHAASIALCIATGACPSWAGGEASVISRQISEFRIGSSETKFGSLEFLGGLEMVSGKALFGSLSSIRFRPDQRHFVVVLDTGQWLTGSIERDAKGKLSGLSDIEIIPMKNRAGLSLEGKGYMDAEGLALDGDRILVSFEQDHRVDIYPDPGFAESRAIGTLPLLIPRKMLKDNRGIETIAVAPPSSPLKGGVVVVSERGLDGEGNRVAAILSGPLKGRFAVARDGSFDVTDGTFLPNGDLLLLERRFNMAEGIGMRLRRIKGADVRPGAVVEGELLLEGNFSSQIDNMEGLDAFQAADGTTHIVLVSDDNHSILQRNLMLEFRLAEEPQLLGSSD